MKKKLVKIEDLNERILVRVELDLERVKYFRDLLATGNEIPPILISQNNDVVDGRHRLAAHRDLGEVEVECEVRNFANDTEMIVEGFCRNCKGALPPSHADVNHTIQFLMAAGVKRGEIITLISEKSGFTKKLVANHLDEVQSELFKARLKKAARAVIHDEAKITDAAEKFGVDREALKEFMSAKSKKHDSSENAIIQIKSSLSMAFVSHNQSVGQNLGNVFDDLKRGAFISEEAEEILKHYDKLLRRATKLHDGWIARFKNHLATQTQSEQAQAKEDQGEGASKDVFSTFGSKVLKKMGL